MSIIAITQQKGGVGKTTITANLAGALASRGRALAVFDLDPQRSLTSWAGMAQGILAPIVKPLETDDARKFRAAVTAAEDGGSVSVLLDCPPGLPAASVMAALVADLVLIPCTPAPLDVLAARQAIALVREARDRRGDGRPLIRFVPSRVMPQTVLGRDLAGALDDIGEPSLPGITQRVAIAESVLLGRTITEHAPGSPAALEFDVLAQAVMKTLKGARK